MPELIEQMYCSQQIVIPPKFPYILKRYCKAAIKTQPYDLLRWSFEYFKALAQNRPPPVKLRLEYPIYSTEGGLTRGCLKVLAQQVSCLAGMTEVPLPAVKAAWQGFCLDQHELKRILCLCQVYLRQEAVPLLHFIAVAGGLLTKTLTHTMILLCETLTKEPDGGSAAIPVNDFLDMYKFLAKLDASKDVKYYDGYMEGESPAEETVEEEEATEASVGESHMESSSTEFWPDCQEFRKLTILDTNVPRIPRLSLKLNMPVLGKIERSPSIERASQIERENYLRERKGRAAPSEEVEKKLRAMSALKMEDTPSEEAKAKEEKFEKKKEGIKIIVSDEDGNEIPYEFYGEPPPEVVEEDYGEETQEVPQVPLEEQAKEEEVVESETEIIAAYVSDCLMAREERREELQRVLDEIATIVDRFKSANYDLGMVAGRQMSTTSGEFIVGHIEKEMMDYVNEQIAVLPDPDLKKKKAKPEEVAMIRDILQNFLDENMDVIIPEPEELEEEEQPVPEITMVYAVPGIGPPVEEEIMREFIDYALDVCKVQGDLFMPRNIRHFMCPPLEKFIEHKYENTEKKEEVPMAGVITD